MKSKFLKIMALVCSLAMLLTLCSCSVVFTKDIITEDRSHKTSEDVAHSEPEKIAESKPEEMQQSKDGFDTPEEAAQAYFDSFFVMDYDVLSNVLYGDYDYIYAMELYMENVDSYYGEGSRDLIDEQIEEEYDTAVFSEAYKQYYLSMMTYDVNLIVSCEIGEECVGQEKELLIESFNDSIIDSHYDDLTDYTDQDNAYAEYMVEANDSMRIASDTQQKIQMVDCTTDGTDDFVAYCIEEDGRWFVMYVPNTTSYEHFALEMTR